MFRERDVMVCGRSGEKIGCGWVAEVGAPSKQLDVGCLPCHPCRGETFWWLGCSRALALPPPPTQCKGSQVESSFSLWVVLYGRDRRDLLLCSQGTSSYSKRVAVCYTTECLCMLEWSCTFPEAGTIHWPMTVLKKITGMNLAILWVVLSLMPIYSTFH